jgi:putative flippase GtrA
MIVKFITFALIGAICTLAHYSILYAAVEFYKINPIWGSGYGALAGLVISYILNYSLTFKSRQSHKQTLPKFALIASLGFCLNIALMTGLTPHLYYLYAQILSTGIVLIWNFLANSLWTFQTDSSKNAGADKPAPPSINRKISTGFDLAFSDCLNQVKSRAALALCISLLFFGLVITYPFPAIDFFKSQKTLATTFQPILHPDQYLLYFMEKPYATQHYQQGKALPLSKITLLQDSLIHSSQ